MATDREKEREAELESAMYTNCLLLGLDPAILGIGGGGGGASPRAGHFRHSNPRLGEQLLHFLLSALRGPVQSAKDFDRVWPIFDSAQSREFRKIVQGIISELESQGALPRSNSRVSSLATCCGPRFVELLWQLSVHALREVHRRTFAADVASNPLPAPLSDVSYLHAAALLPVTKARIALERGKFLKNANIAVQRQTTRSNLANEMTAEFRSLCAEEAYLQQELEKLQGMRNKAKLEGELWDDRISGSSGQNSHPVSKATRLWESLLSRKSQHEILASGPIEDLIAHREHRYRISGASLLAAMDLSSHVPHSDLISVRDGEMPPTIDQQEQIESPQLQGKIESLSISDDRVGRVHTTVDVAEILRRWTHALQRIHKQSLHFAKANDGEGPGLLRCVSDGEANGHAESLAATLAEHRQHLVSIQVLINQLKESIPAMQKSISELSEEANSISANTMDELNAGLQLSGRTHGLGRPPIDKVANSPALKLPPLFSLSPNSSARGTNITKRNATRTQTSPDKISEGEPFSLPPMNRHTNGPAQEKDDYDPHDIRRSVRQTALSKPSSNLELLQDKSSDDGSEHFFIPLSTAASRKDIRVFSPDRRKQRQAFSKNTKDLRCNMHNKISSSPVPSSKLNGLDEHGDAANHPPPSAVDSRRTFPEGVDSQRIFPEVDSGLDQVFPHPLLMESSLFLDTYEDLLAPLSETDAALMEH